MRSSTRALFAITACLAGCRIGTLSPEELDREYPLARLTTLASPGREEALEALREAVGGSPVRITAMTMFDDRMQITAQNPRTPSNFDRYTYWQGDVTIDAVELRGDDEARLKQILFDLDSVPFDRLPELALDARKQLPIDGARISRVNVDPKHRRSIELEATEKTGGLQIEFALDSERRDGRVVYDERGTLISAKAD